MHFVPICGIPSRATAFRCTASHRMTAVTDVQHSRRGNFIIRADERSRPGSTILMHMVRTLYRPLLPRSKCGRPLPATLPTGANAFILGYVQVVWRKRMSIGASTWYRAGVWGRVLAHSAGGEANHFGFGGSKARPGYHTAQSPRVTRLIQR